MKCVKCSNPATVKVLWAEGMGYQPACEKHKESVADKFRHKTHNGKPYDDFSGFRKMSSLDIQMLAFMDEMQKTSGFLTDVGQTIKRTAANPGRALGTAAVGVGRDVLDLGKSAKNQVANWIAHGGPRKELHGAVRAFQENPLKSIPKGMSMAAKNFRNSGRLGQGLHILSTASNVASLAQKEDPSGQGRSRTSRGLEFAGGELGRYAGMPFSALGAHLTSSVGRKAGRVVGSAIDRVRNKGHVAQDLMHPHISTEELPQRVEKSEE